MLWAIGFRASIRAGVKSEDDDLRRDAEAHGDDARADAGSHKEVATAFLEMPLCVELAEARGDDGAADYGQVDLPAVRVSGER
jgi:hypothetical protein